MYFSGKRTVFWKIHCGHPSEHHRIEHSDVMDSAAYD